MANFMRIPFSGGRDGLRWGVHGRSRAPVHIRRRKIEVNRSPPRRVVTVSLPVREEPVMPVDPDAVLLETVTTHRARLHSAFLYGQLAERRPVNDNVRRLTAGIVLAAVACAGCIGFAIVTGVIADQSAQRRGQSPPPAPPSASAAVSPIRSGGPDGPR
jgi:hypothetical protein